MEKARATPRFIKRSEAVRAWGMSRTTAWRLERDDPTFPKPIRLGPGLYVYEASAVEAWERSKIAAAMGQGAK
jgi:predicted DNA-binding transcriptional regulator AlpA